MRRELTWRRPEGMKFDITPRDHIDDSTWDMLDQLSPRRRVLLYYSTGKDSAAAWLALHQRGYQIVPVFKEIVRGLSFFERVIAAHEDYFGTQVHIIPHKVLYLNRMRFYNTPEDLASLGVDLKNEILAACESKSYTTRYNRLVTDKLLEEHHCDVAIIGTKASDSLHRRTHFSVDGPYLPRERLFSLCWRIGKSQPYLVLLNAKVPIPLYYLWLGRSPELILQHEIYLIKKYFPQDFETLKGHFKSLEAYVQRYDLKHETKTPAILVKAHKEGTVTFV